MHGGDGKAGGGREEVGARAAVHRRQHRIHLCRLLPAPARASKTVSATHRLPASPLWYVDGMGRLQPLPPSPITMHAEWTTGQQTFIPENGVVLLQPQRFDNIDRMHVFLLSAPLKATAFNTAGGGCNRCPTAPSVAAHHSRTVMMHIKAAPQLWWLKLRLAVPVCVFKHETNGFSTVRRSSTRLKSNVISTHY